MTRHRIAATTAALVGAATLVVPAAPGRAADGGTVVGGPAAAELGYLTTSVRSPKGATATFVNLDPVASHDVVSKATRKVKVRGRLVSRPLFRSALVAFGASVPVSGTEAVKAGDYEFFCSLHSGMVGTLHVQ